MLEFRRLHRTRTLFSQEGPFLFSNLLISPCLIFRQKSNITLVLNYAE